ncbi:conjugated bile salt MFS transporter [[Clostridium] dakarense]|uniref:conjugated bile salt MFS transporter n=1 Tax=Faecalimicrobium dakarense TaxID=1301100 RepID=UPI0004B00AD1|nr:conjugated bile salt MFS transporter [[Clostridium] dakarense]
MSEIRKQNRENKFIFGWLVVIGCMIIQAIPFGVASNIHPQFISYVVEGEGFSLAQFSLMFTIGTIASSVASPLIGRGFAKYPAKFLFLIGSIFSGGGILLLSLSHELWMFYLGYSIAQIGTVAISSIGIPLLITAWFDDDTKGQAMGLAFAGGSIGNIFLQQAVVRILFNYGYGKAYLWFSILSLIVGIVTSLLLIRMPKDESETIKNKASKSKMKEKVPISVDWGYTFGEVKGMASYWIYAVGFIFIGIYVSALAVQYPAYLRFIGFEPFSLAMVGSLFALASLLGNIIGGILFDKIGMIKTMIIGFILASLACICLIFSPQAPILAYVFAISKGLSVFAYMIAPSYLAGSLFGKKDFGTILAVSNIFFALGFACGSTLFGIIVDSMGYLIAWPSMLISIIIGYIMVLSVIGKMSETNRERISRLQN